MPVNYVCCFASVMWKQVDYHPLISIYGPYSSGGSRGRQSGWPSPL